MILVDGNNLLWRAHYAAPDLQRRDGKWTGALHMTLEMMADFVYMFNEDIVWILWDGVDYWRKDIYPEYKANRAAVTKEDKRKHEEVYRQRGLLMDMFKILGIGQYLHRRLEADDWAGLLTEPYEDDSDERDIAVTLVSSDKDWFQLLRKNRIVQVRKWAGGKLDMWDSDRVNEELGVTPRDIPKWLALTGDKADNILQVRKGLGPKRAANMLRASGLALNGYERKQYEFNLRLTQAMRYPPSYVDPLACRSVWPRPEKTSQLRIDMFDEIAAAHELESVQDFSRQLWELGKWRKRS